MVRVRFSVRKMMQLVVVVSSSPIFPRKTYTLRKGLPLAATIERRETTVLLRMETTLARSRLFLCTRLMVSC